MERINLKIIEEVDDTDKVNNETLMQILNIFDEFGNSSELSQRAIKDTYQEIVNRGHTFNQF